jgi:hypothetical protein
MRLLKLLAIPLLILATGVVYWFLSYEWAGTVLLLMFSVALAVMFWVLGPTVDDVGPTAPVDTDWHERQG